MRTTTTNKNHYDVDVLKRQLQVDHSEDVFGIEPEIPTQCPRIDLFKKDVDALFEHIKRMKTLIEDGEDNAINAQLNIPYLQREIEIIRLYENSLDIQFEELRTACDSLRTRGSGWKQLARNLFNKVPNNKSFIPADILKKIK